MTIVKFVEIVMRYIWCLCVSPDDLTEERLRSLIIKLNLDRRHLTPSQKAWIAAGLANIEPIWYLCDRQPLKHQSDKT